MPTKTRRFADALAYELVSRGILDAIAIEPTHPVAQASALTRSTRQFQRRPGLFAEPLKLGVEHRVSQTDIWGHYLVNGPVPTISMNVGYFGASPNRASARLGLDTLRQHASDFVDHELGHRALRIKLATRRGRREVRAIFRELYGWSPDLSDGEGKEKIPKSVAPSLKRGLMIHPEGRLDDVDEAVAIAYEEACQGSRAAFSRAILQCINDETDTNRYTRVRAPSASALAESFGLTLSGAWR